MGPRIFLLPVIGATTFFVLLFTFTKLFGPIPFSVNSVTTTKSDSFSVTGEGKIFVKPDIATVNVGVQASGATVKAAQDQLNSNINKVSEAIKKLGIDSKDIQTSNYTINPTRGDFNAGSAKITGYDASTNLSIKVRQIDKANSVIDAATAAGANQIGGINFEVDDKSKFEDQARKMAVDEAKKKAEQAANTAGFRLGKIVNYSESFAGEPRPYPMMLEAADKAVTPPTQVEPGTNQISITVTLSYEIF